MLLRQAHRWRRPLITALLVLGLAGGLTACGEAADGTSPAAVPNPDPQAPIAIDPAGPPATPAPAVPTAAPSPSSDFPAPADGPPAPAPSPSPPTYTLQATASGGGSVSPSGETTHDADAPVTLTASWNPRTHRFEGWGGDCSGTATTCIQMMDADKTVTATFAKKPAAATIGRIAPRVAAQTVQAGHRIRLDVDVFDAAGRRLADPASVSGAVIGWYIAAAGNGARRQAEANAAVTGERQNAAFFPGLPLASVTGHPESVTYTAPTDRTGQVVVRAVMAAAACPGRNGIDSDAAAVWDGPCAAAFTITLPEPPPGVSYNFYDRSGAVTRPGSYAFFTAPAVSSVITTYEGLRRDAAVLRIHAADADGTARVSLFDAIAVGDLIERYETADCFERYRVTTAPAAGPAQAYREFGLRPESYVFQGCQEGPVPATAPTRFRSAGSLPLTAYGGALLQNHTFVHGPWQLVPRGWTGAVAPSEYRQPPVYSGENPIYTSDLAVARRLPFWRDPKLPQGQGWVLGLATSGV